MGITDIVGYLAAIFGTSIMLPQVFKTLKTKRVKDLSTTMLIVYIVNCTLWEIYGLLIGSMPIIACNLAALAIGVFQFVLKHRYRNIES